ncbi:hypothetical protein ACICHK_01630 [Streptomyces sp. AHU1]
MAMRIGINTGAHGDSMDSQVTSPLSGLKGTCETPTTQARNNGAAPTS